MARLLFDIETDGFLPTLTKVHCVAIYDLDDPDAGVQVYHSDDTIERDGVLALGLLRLHEATELYAHGAYSFDIPALQKVFPKWRPQGKVHDTLVRSRLAFPDLWERDCKRKYEGFPTRVWGRHSLEAWGLRLGIMKGDYCGGWEFINADMVAYCKQDVVVLRSLHDALEGANVDPRAIDLEERFAYQIERMNRRGVTFDDAAAEDLERRLTLREAEVEDHLRQAFDDFHDPYVTPKKKLERVKVTEFNPGSRAHLARALQEQRGWDPTEFTETGRVKLDEDTIDHLEFDDAHLIQESLMLDKRLGALSRGKTAWRTLAKGGIIKPRVLHIGTVYGRCSHSRPNVTQVVKPSKPWGPEMRALWQPREGYVLLGADLKGIDLRVLAHLLVPHDKGAFRDQIVEGDIHTFVQKMVGLDSRDDAKTMEYATLYGAGPPRIARSIKVSLSRAKRMQAQFKDKLKINALVKGITGAVKKRKRGTIPGYLTGLDGRRIPVSALRKALNYVVAGGSSVVVKLWTVLTLEASEHLDRHLLIHAHDEMQIEVRPEHADELTEIARAKALEAGEVLGLRIPTPADVKTGNSWSETH